MVLVSKVEAISFLTRIGIWRVANAPNAKELILEGNIFIITFLYNYRNTILFIKLDAFPLASGKEREGEAGK